MNPFTRRGVKHAVSKFQRTSRVAVRGKQRQGVLHAVWIENTVVANTAAGDDPALKRYLALGDSISLLYDEPLRQTLAGKLNVHRPAVNCGNSSNGRARLHEWLGADMTPGHGWDVISFNFGLWDAYFIDEPDRYEKNLEAIIRRLEQTGARLVWVTSTPVPQGYGTEDVYHPGVSRKLNAAALEVVKRHPGILVFDAWQLVKDGEQGRYSEWWQGNDLHISGELARPLAEGLAATVLGALVQTGEQMQPSAE